MIPRATSSFQIMFPETDQDLVSPNSSASTNSHTSSSSLHFNLSVLKDKISELQTLVGVIVSPDQSLHESTTSMAISSMNSTIQEIIVTATSMMFTCQQMSLNANFPPGTSSNLHHQQQNSHHHDNKLLSQSNFSNNNKDGLISNNNIGSTSYTRGQSLFPSNDESEALEWFGHENYKGRIVPGSEGSLLREDMKEDHYMQPYTCSCKESVFRFKHMSNQSQRSNYYNCANSCPQFSENYNNENDKEDSHGVGINENNNNSISDEGYGGINISSNDEIIELDAADLLAKYTHYCQVCGKGFKRDANLRMHMRAHGDEYKTNAALSNPIKSSECNNNNNNLMSVRQKKFKYSCPQEGCRWNKKHAKFQPLKSMICVKNHYKRSHCPKMYVCKRCNLKQFSVLSDLRTHEKHCGDQKWQCSCGTTFSRKDKLMGHVGLFVGHHPIINGMSYSAGKLEQQGLQMQISASSR